MNHRFKAKNGQDDKSKVVICRHDHHIARVACAFCAAGTLCVFGGAAHLRAGEIQADGICYTSVGLWTGANSHIKIFVICL